MGSLRETGCPFCRIVDGSDPDAHVVGEAERWVAFFPLHPATRGHTLVVPRRHVRDFWEADEALAAELAVACSVVGRALTDLLAPDGMNLITSAGDAAEQTIFHLHLHVVPRWRGDAIGPIWPAEPDNAKTGSPELVRDLQQALAAHQGEGAGGGESR